MEAELLLDIRQLIVSLLMVHIGELLIVLWIVTRFFRYP